MRKVVFAFFAAVALGVAAAPSASAGQCGLPDAQPLWIDFSDGSPDHWSVFARPGVIVGTSNFIYPPRLRAAGAKTIYFDINFWRRIGTPSAPVARAVVEERASRLFDYAAASSACSRPLIALNELFGAHLPTPWSPTNANYRANVLSFARILALRGARPFLLISRRPYTGGEAAGWWREVAQYADIVREVYFPAPAIYRQGPVLGSRSLRTMFREGVADLLALGIPPTRIGLMLGFQTTPGLGGRERLERQAWFQVVKLQALAAKQVARELKLASIWSWGWATWGGRESDPDKPAAACVWLWARSPKLCNGPRAAGRGFNASLTEGQINRLGSAQCTFGNRRIGRLQLARLASVTGDRDVAHSALYARLVESEHARVTAERIVAAERAVVASRFGGSYRAYRAALARGRANVVIARGVIADELRRAAIEARLRVAAPTAEEVNAFYSTSASLIARLVEAVPAPAWLGGRRRGLALSTLAPAALFSLPTGRRVTLRTMTGRYAVRALGPAKPLASVPLAQARPAIAAALRRFARANAFQSWTTTRQTRSLARLVCARDELPAVAPVELSAYLPFLALDG